MESFQDFCQGCSNGDLTLILILYGEVKFAFLALLCEEFSELADDCVQHLINTNEHKNIFFNRGQDHPSNLNQCLLYSDSLKLSDLFK